MCRTGMCRFVFGNWIFLLAALNLFTNVQAEDSPEPGVQLTAEPADAVVPPRGRTLLPCAASPPRARLLWRYRAESPPTRDHVLPRDDAYRKQLSNGSLAIEAMSSALVGHYQCVASVDGIGTIVSRVATVGLAEVTSVEGGPRSVLGAAGGAVLLPCGARSGGREVRVDNAPARDRRVYGAHHRAPTTSHAAAPVVHVNVTWLRNGAPLQLEATRMSLTPSGALEIDPARAADAGRYTCRVQAPWQAHMTSEDTELHLSTDVAELEYPPRFIATPKPATVMEGASVTFECAAVGNPKPEMIWLNNGVAIDLNDLDSRFYLVGSGSLRVQWARPLDAGVYTCRAHNRLDSADSATQLNVMSAPRVSVAGGAGAVRAAARGAVTLNCNARGRPAPAVTWLKDGEPLTPNHHDITLLDGHDLHIQGVLPVDAGMFQCVATSEAGNAVAALRLHVAPPADESSTLKISSKPIPNANTSSVYTKPHDIFSTLVSSDDDLDPDLDLDLDLDLNPLGETSSAYTSQPDTLALDYNYIGMNSLHAAKGLDLDNIESVSNETMLSAPKGLKAVIVKHRFVTLSWEEPDNKFEDITGYAVVYKVKGSERERTVRGASQRHEMNVASLQPNTTYQFRVVALTHHAVSPPSDIVEALTTAEEQPYGAVTSLRALPSGPHTLAVSWRAPHPPPPLYTLHYTEAESGRTQYQSCSASGTTVESCSISGLRAGAVYSLRVEAGGGAPDGGGGPGGEAEGSGGEGAVGGGAELRVRTPGDVPAAPPATVSAETLSATSILVRWEAPAPRTHRGPLTGYKVRYRAGAGPPGGAGGGSGAGGRRKAESLTTPADARRAELRGLERATTYQIRVCAINANGSGPFSEWVTAATADTAAEPETAVPAPPPPLTTRAGRDWISVWWGAEGGGGGGAGAAVRGYSLSWGLGVPDDHVRSLPAHTHSHLIKQLQSNAEYVISLRASNALGLGPAVYATVRTKPPTEDEDMEDGDEDGDGQDDDMEDEEDRAPPLIPPVGLKVIMLSGTTAVVYWTDPTLPKGQTATDGRRYVVRWSTSGGRARTFNATDLNCMIDELKPYTTYDFAVKLIKGGRESAWSLLVSNTSLEAAPGGAPRDLRLLPASPRALDLAWAPPQRTNGHITSYIIMYAAESRGGGGGGGGGDWVAVEVGGERRGARVDRLRPRTTYVFKVQARNAKGLGPFTQPQLYTTPDESVGALHGATSVWLWASAGGALAVLALAAALALSLCCRRPAADSRLSAADCSTYQKSSATAAIKPPDLWIHHDQMELKHMDKSLHSSASKISAGSVDNASALVSSTLTLGRAPPGEYEPAGGGRHLPLPPPASLDRRHVVPAYVEWRRSPSCAGSEDTAVMRASPPCRYLPMSGVGCTSTCDRRAPMPRPAMPHPDQSTPLLSTLPPGLISPQASLGSLHPPPAPCGSGTCPLGAACGAAGGMGAGVVVGGGDVYAVAARERGHYVAYEPLGHYTHRDSLSSDGVGGGAVGGSLQRRVGPAGGVSGAAGGGALHSFTLPSDASSNHSTPSHGKGSVRETSPYKKGVSSSPGHAPNRLQLGPTVQHCAEELEPLTPSRSTERLHREMANLEGLMKDLSAITQQQFHC